MARTAFLWFFVLLLAIGALFLGQNGCAGGNTSGNGGTNSPSNGGSSSPNKIQHVVVVFQENRTPDNLFHGLPNADIANSGVNSLGQTIPLQPIPLANRYDLGHRHNDFLRMYDNGKMDGADKVSGCNPNQAGCPPNPQFQYVNPSDVAPYFQLAQQYTFGDRMFQTNQGPSFPAHQFIISGTSAPTATSTLFAAENTNLGAGCTATPAAWVWMIDASGAESSKMYPCFEHPTLTDLLDSAGKSWKYYTPSNGGIWVGPNAIQHICAPANSVCTGPDWVNNVVLNNTQVLTDISSGQLPAVSWVIPTGQASDHPGNNNGTGPSWVASIVNAIGGSSYWSNTAVIITWDDWGGWYDHVPPPKVIEDRTSWGSGYVYGFRVPLIIVSPYAKVGYVSHVTHDFGSILKFIEQIFSLPSLGYADAAADDLSDCFNFSQTPLQFHTIAAPLSAEHFLNDRTPPLDPDDD
ncbi:MAG TPA: alkaline phosphatase family protein [Terriglobales bacterium]|nr:alkaline phosphatase family protein [Terriglobales bacterium]